LWNRETLLSTALVVAMAKLLFHFKFSCVQDHFFTNTSFSFKLNLIFNIQKLIYILQILSTFNISNFIHECLKSWSVFYVDHFFNERKCFSLT